MKTNLDLYLSAQKAAHDLLNTGPVATVAHALHTAALERFNSEGHDPADWDYWFLHFGNQRTFLTGLSSQKTVSQVALEAAAKLALAMKPKTSEVAPT